MTPTHRAEKVPSLQLAIGASVLAAIALAGLGGFVKSLADLYPALMIAWVRFLLMVVFVGAANVGSMRSTLYRSRVPQFQLVRGVLALVITLASYSALKYLPLAECTAIIFLSPALSVLLACLWLKEKVDRTTWLAILLGLCGVVLIVRPGGAVFTPAVLLPMSAALCLAVYNVITRRVASDDSPATTTFLTALFGLAALTLFSPGFLTVPNDASDWAGFLMVGVLASVGQLATAVAYSHGPTRVIAPMANLSLVFAVIIGWAAFSDVPDVLAGAGIVSVIASGTVIALRR